MFVGQMGRQICDGAIFGQLASIPSETRDELANLRTQVSALTGERDELRDQVPALMLECDRVRAQVRIGGLLYLEW